MSVIKIEGLTRDYGGGRGVFDLDMDVAQGEVFGFLGPNGAGKTTAMRHLTGFLKPQKGRCSINGLDCRTQSEQIHKNLGYLPGEIAFFDDMTGLDFLTFRAKYCKMSGTGRMKELLDYFELDAKGGLKKMSKGMRQKIGIVAAFMHDPDVLILDEPTSGLDPLMQSRFIELIINERKRGKTILMSSHIFDEVERTCRRVAIIRDGRLAAVDEVERLKEVRTKRFTVTLDSPDSALKLRNEAGGGAEMSGNSVTLSITNDINGFISLIGRYDVKNLSTPSQSLEEIFMQFYGREDKKND